MKRNTHTIDASTETFGRLATQIAIWLRGKHKADFSPHIDGGDRVVVENIERLKVSGRKMEGKIYYHHTGYPGGIKDATMKELVAKKGYAEVLTRAVWGMLPKNKLRSEMIKRLTIK